MANFDKAFKKVIYYEGGYVNDIEDAGGETYMGISRKHNPKLEMWNIIDKYKTQYKDLKSLKLALKINDNLTEMVKEVYKTKYWDVLNLDNCKRDTIAYQIFDTAVNMGVSKARTILNRVKHNKNVFE